MSDAANKERDARDLLHSAFTFVRSVESNKASAPITLDHVLRQQLLFLKAGETRSIVDASGRSVGDRISRYDELTQLKAKVDALVAEAKGKTTEFGV